MNAMNALVIINNFNYGRYLDECIGSVMKQTRVPDRVVIVDDGSTDDSLAVIQRWRQRHSRIALISKSNGGQLSCFNAAVPYVQSNDVVFLLDADDTYPSNYIETVLSHYNADVDMVFAEKRCFGSEIGKPVDCCRTGDAERIVTIEMSTHVNRLLMCWLGRPTSGISLCGSMYHRLLPYKDEMSWMVCADNILVHGASLVGGAKRFLLDVSYNYRVHGHNRWHGKPEVFHNKERQAALLRLIEHMASCPAAPVLPTGHIGLIMGALRECQAVPRRMRCEIGLPPIHWILLPPLLTWIGYLVRWKSADVTTR